jgi:uncharacterized protein
MTASDSQPPPQPGPVTQGDRIASIDVLRGFALLGILVMNIQTFAMIEAAYFNPTAYGDFTGPNFLVWLFSHAFADQKFMTIFSMLFGAGIVLMAERAESKGLRPAGAHYRRMLWLVLFGILHAHLLWYGDVLYWYGMCGLVVYLFRRLRAPWLIVLGLLSLVLVSVLFVFLGWSMQFWPEEAMTDVANDWQPPPDKVAEELRIYRGGWLEQMARRGPAAREMETFVFFVWGAWRAGGLMLIGMALYKLGVFGARLSRAVYLVMASVGLLLGLAVVLYGVSRNLAADWGVSYSQFFGWQFNHWGSLLVSAAWVGLVMLVCQQGVWSQLTQALAAVGQMAFTNYMLQTIICTTIFYGHGFGLFGHVERVGQIGIVFAVWALQLAISPIWLRHYRFGPLEWLWRSLTYLAFQPMRRGT